MEVCGTFPAAALVSQGFAVKRGAASSKTNLRIHAYRGDSSGSAPARIASDTSRRRQLSHRAESKVQYEDVGIQHNVERNAFNSPRPQARHQSPRTKTSTSAAPKTASRAVAASVWDQLSDEGSASTSTQEVMGEAGRRKALQLKSNLRAQSRNPQRPGAGETYRPSTALGLARRRMLNKYFPYDWQLMIRRKAEEIPETQFNYIVSGLLLITTSLLAGVAAWFAWPITRELVITAFHANDIEARVLQELTFETQFLSAISLVTAILLGNTFAFSFDRQRSIIQEMSEEVFAVELLLQEAFLSLPEPHLRWRIIKHVRRYVETEIQARSIESPFRIDGAIVGLFTVLAALRQEGRDIARMLRAVEMMAQANSRRVSVAAALLPPLHWVMLASLCGLLLLSFILFDSDFNSTVIENRVLFAILAGMLFSILQVLQDIANPDDGLYSVRDAMDNRLSYVRWQMDHILNDPAIKVSLLGGETSDEFDDDSDAEDGARVMAGESEGRRGR